MSTMDYDLFVIGAGSGGVRAARMSAQLGARVGIAEPSALGGTCVNVGCVPKKLFVYASQFARGMEAARGYGLSVDAVSFDWATLRDNKDAEIKRLNVIYGSLLTNAGVTLYEHRAEVEGPNRVRVDDRSISAERILIATGGWPFVPAVEGCEHMVTSNEFFHLDEWPDRVVVVGGGYIAVELAGVFNGTGVETHLVHRSKALLRGFDEEVRTFAAEQYAADGIHLHLENEIEFVRGHGGDYGVGLTDGTELTAGLVLAATGRQPNTAGLGLEQVGVDTDESGAVRVDNRYQTSIPSVYAIGDVIDRTPLTPVALAEGTYLAHEWFGHGAREVRYDTVSTAVFSEPSIGTVGLTEEAARARHGNVDVYVSSFRPMQNTLSGSPLRAMMKLIVDPATDRILGAHMVGPDAGEIMQGFSVAYAMGATKADFDQTVGIHPTSAEEFVTMRGPQRQ